MNSVNFEVLDLSNYNSEQDIILAYIDIGKMPPKRASQYLEEVKALMNPKFEERGFDVIYIARNRDGETSTTIKVASKETARERFDEAIKTVK